MGAKGGGGSAGGSGGGLGGGGELGGGEGGATYASMLQYSVAAGVPDTVLTAPEVLMEMKVLCELRMARPPSCTRVRRSQPRTDDAEHATLSPGETVR